MNFLLSCLLLSAPLTLEEKVGQLLLVHFNGESVNPDALKLIHDAKVGGFIYYNWANGLNHPSQVRELSAGLQQEAKIPLFISIDQEGGLVTRLNKGFTTFPGNGALGKIDDLQLTQEQAFYLGKELKDVGINLNLAPVVDINSELQNPIVGIRSFGSSPEKVIAHAKATLEGFNRAGMLSCLKHFPGLGSVHTDPHLDTPLVDKTKEALFQTELAPFKQLGPDADSVMTAHILVPSLDRTSVATLSSPILEKLLRQEMGYNGVVISDSLVMEGALKQEGSLTETALKAFQAGCDILLVGGKQLQGSGLEATVQDIFAIQQRFIQAVKEGSISEARLNQSVERILTLKNKIRPPQSLTFSEKKAAHKLHEAIARQAIEVIKAPLFSLKGKKAKLLAPEFLRPFIQSTSTAFYDPVHALHARNEIKRLEEGADILIFASYNSWSHPEQLQLVQSLKKPVVVFCLADPLDAAFFPSATGIIATHSPTLSSLQAAFEAVHLPSPLLRHIAEKIWKNECGQTFTGLTSWNQGEPFASLGIGHFIWFPANIHPPFHETFPALLTFLEQEGIELPKWLKINQFCPWNTKKEFDAHLNDPKMNELRQLLYNTLDCQALFISKRLHVTLERLSTRLSEKRKEMLETLQHSPQGLYALMDYFNFKGDGLDEKESYQGQGWGLLQVLSAIPETSQAPLADFVKAAKSVLKARVAHCPSERQEQKWLEGWLKRVDTYL